MASKSFIRSSLEYLLAVPMSLHLFGSSFGADSFGSLVTPLVLRFQTTSGAFWTELLGDGSKGPREHLFLTFTALVFMPSLAFLLLTIVKYRKSSVPFIRSDADLCWFGLNCIGTFVLSYALIQKYYYAATSLVLIFLMVTFLIRYAVMPGGNELFFQRFTPPKRDGGNELSRKAAPWMLLFVVVIQLQITIAEFPRVEEGRWLYVVSIAVQFWIIILSSFLNNRLPAKVFLVFSGIFLCEWINRNIIDVIRMFSDKWGIA